MKTKTELSKLQKLSKVAIGASILLASAFANAKTVYVAPNGNDSVKGAGTSSVPFKTLTKAANSGLKPGDVVIVRNGIYKERLLINASGSAAGSITFRSEELGGAKIDATGKTHGILIFGDYVTVDGFDVYKSNGSGIAAQECHHVNILNNESFDNQGAGIYVGKSDYINVANNVVFRNAAKGVTSGISIHIPENITGNPSKTDFRIIVRNNVAYDNMMKDPNKNHTDGNGIILDDFRSTKHPERPAYAFPALVENNVTFSNGGAGIMIFANDNAVVRNNSAWGNKKDLVRTGTWRGEIQNQNSSNIIYANNVAHANLALHKDNVAFANVSLKGYTNKNVSWFNNISFNGKAGAESVLVNNGASKPTAADGNIIGKDPKFASPSAKNFRLVTGSPAINTGTTTKAKGVHSSDITGTARIKGGKVDMGAYEMQ